jgi:protein-S-isoprenylcysteine O-methyltransferase Ste14
VQAVGVVGFTLALAVIVWVMHVNRFFSSVIRIQAERGYHVISTGPYRWVRHPGYAAMLLVCPTSGLALGSWLSTVPMLAFIPFILYRTLAEDWMLKRALPGYASYAEQVHYRLFPKIC